jgi:hypothetical protein
MEEEEEFRINSSYFFFSCGFLFDFVVVCDVVAGPLAYKSRCDSSFFLQRFTKVQLEKPTDQKRKKMFTKILLVALFTSMVLAIDYQQREADDEAQQIQPTARFFAFQTTKTTVTVVTV